MKILWFCNIMLPRISAHLSQEVRNIGGWLVGLSESLLNVDGIELSIAFPLQNTQSIVSGETDNLKYYGFPQRKSDINKYNRNIEKYAETIIMQENPDIVHIFGTEFPHTLAIVNACERLEIIDKVVINIQGLVSIIAKHYCSGLPNTIINRYTLRDFIRQDNIKQQSKKFLNRGKYEIESLQKVRHIIGKSDLDRACATHINLHVKYYLYHEILREDFYDHNWDITKCEKYSIFLSQASYPIKGLHFVLEALPEIIKRFPDTHVYIAGNDITKTDNLTQKMKISSYGKYIKKLIKKYCLDKYITFMNSLNEKAMCERFLKSHVFVLPSSIENPPNNSLGEAMLLGVPSISSVVGGVENIITNNKEGYFYQHDAPYMLSYYICKLFSDDEIALEFSKNAKMYAENAFNKEKNLEEIVDIYNEILKCKR